MTSQIRTIAECCFHDAEVLGFEQVNQSIFPFPEPAPFWSSVAVLSLKQDKKLRSLIYSLWDRVRENATEENWPFSKKRKHWLYDELDVAEDHRGMFLHRVLFSDGSAVEIPFVSVIATSVALPDAEGSAMRQTA
jgi:hypothetical protein